MHESDWRWCFWSTTIFDAVLQLLVLASISETYMPVLKQRAEILERKLVSMDIGATTQALRLALRRPFYMLWTQPVLQLSSVLSGVTFGILYMIISTIHMLFMSVYGQSHRAAALHYISLGIGFVAGAQLMGLTTDWLYRRDSQPKPELRIKLLLPSIVVAGLGLLCLGWSAKARTHWIVPDIGLVLFSAGYQCATQCQNAYIINVYGPKGWSASANAGIWAVKSIAGLCFPLFAPALYRSHG